MGHGDEGLEGKERGRGPNCSCSGGWVRFREEMKVDERAVGEGRLRPQVVSVGGGVGGSEQGHIGRPVRNAYMSFPLLHI